MIYTEGLLPKASLYVYLLSQSIMTKTMPILETERLILREFTIADASFMVELLNTPSWLQYIGERNVRTIAEAEVYLLNGSIKSYAENGFGFYAVVEKTSQQTIGLCGLTNRTNLPDSDIGFAFLPDFMCKGFGFEAAGATLDFAKSSLGLKKIIAIVQPDNGISIKLLKKIGMQPNGLIAAYPNEAELMLFTISFE
jgi:[ribosomal protein S5]-alanine N-acetyltransferase